MAVPHFSGHIWREGLFVAAEFSVEAGRIKGIQPVPKPPHRYIIPPYADPHIHGGWGFSFQDAEFESLEKKLLHRGVFFAIPTLQNTGMAALKKSAHLFKSYKQDNPQSIFPFLRVEGPFISPVKKGFQREDFILEVNPAHIQEFLSIDEIGLFTFAPEREGMQALVKQALAQGKIPSFGHSQAAYADFLKFYSMGVRHMTHYPNAMSGLHHREIGLTGAGLLKDDLLMEVIADGIHSSLDFLDLLLHVKGPNFGLASDMIPPAYCERPEFDGRRLHQKGKSFTTDAGVLAGGGTQISEQVHLLFEAGFQPEYLIPLACLNTLTAIGHPLPQMAEGAAASFLVLDKRFDLQEAYRWGNKQ